MELLFGVVMQNYWVRYHCLILYRVSKHHLVFLWWNLFVQIYVSLFRCSWWTVFWIHILQVFALSHYKVSEWSIEIVSLTVLWFVEFILMCLVSLVMMICLFSLPTLVRVFYLYCADVCPRVREREKLVLTCWDIVAYRVPLLILYVALIRGIPRAVELF